jgi:ABC-type branched-subunit amino acid transport system ATPase component
VRAVLEIADRVYVLRSGSVSFEGPAHELTQEADLTRVYL